MSTKTEAILLRIGADAAALRKELASGRNSLSVFTKEIDVSRNALVRFAGTVAAGLGLAALAREAIEYADQVRKVADQTGLATDEVQRLMFIAGQTGANIDALAGTISKMQRTLVDASEDGKKAREAIAGLGLDVTQLMNQKPADQFQTISEAIAGIADPAKQAAVAVDIFGKSGAEALPMIKAMAQDGAALAAQFDAIGGPASQAAIDRVDALGDSFTATGMAAKTVTTELLAIIAPAIISGLELVQQTLNGIRVIAGKGSNEAVNLSMEIDALTEQINALEKSRGIAAQSTQDHVAALKRERQQLLDQKDAMDGLGTTGAALRVELEAVNYTIGQMPVLTAYALGEVDAMLEDQLQRQLERDARWREQMAADMELRREIAQHGQDSIGEVQAVGLTKMEEFNRLSWDAQTATVAGSLQEMTAGIAQHSKAAFEVNKAAAIVNTVVQTIQAVTKAWADYGWPVGAIIGAAVAAAGVAQVNAIKSTSFQGGGRGVPPSGATTPPVNTATAGGGGGGGGQQDTLRVQGLGANDIFSGSMVSALATRLLEYQADGGRVVLES